MKLIEQLRFSEPADAAALDAEPLVVHRHSDASADQLVIFVHGLGGGRYGAGATWGNFPKFLFDQSPQIDVGLYKYVSGLERLKFKDSIDLKDEALIFANTIRDGLKAYKKIVLVGHSMGGLLCKGVIAALIDNKETELLSKIAGLILMAVPQLGSLRVPAILAWLSPDSRVLRAHSDYIEKVNSTLENHVSFTEESGDFDKYSIPAWAVLGASDFWVDRMSAGIGLPASRKKFARGSHTQIVKPRSDSDEIYVWTRERILKCLRPFQYDVFLACAMAALETEDDYREAREQALQIVDALRSHCGFESVFYAGLDLATKKDFEAQSIALREDVVALKESRYFLLLYREKLVSSVLFEAGLALALGKPSVYLVTNRNHLPYLMKEASQAKIAANVEIYEQPDIEAMIYLIREHREALWGMSH